MSFFVGTILSIVYALGGRRSITFSSFSPEVCILLATKQQDHAVLFITKARNVSTGDIRTSILQQAVHFAKAWGLAGTVSVIKPFQIRSRLVRYIKHHVLVVATYGTTDDDPETTKISDVSLVAARRGSCAFRKSTKDMLDAVRGWARRNHHQPSTADLRDTWQ